MTTYLSRRAPLANGQGHALVWSMDYELVSQYHWKLSRRQTGYAARGYYDADGKKHTQFMHQLITGVRNADHKNRNGLDNRRSNLRVGASSSEQNANRGKQKNNTSGYIGVSWDKQHGKWDARVMKDKKTVWRVLFVDREVAARARDAKALEIYGEFAVLNFVEPVARVEAARSSLVRLAGGGDKDPGDAAATRPGPGRRQLIHRGTPIWTCPRPKVDAG